MPKRPKLRTVEKYKPPYPINKFPHDFALNLGREIVYFLATRGTSRLEERHYRMAEKLYSYGKTRFCFS